MSGLEYRDLNSFVYVVMCKCFLLAADISAKLRTRLTQPEQGSSKDY
jgi:hypothetical protein